MKIRTVVSLYKWTQWPGFYLKTFKSARFFAFDKARKGSGRGKCWQCKGRGVAIFATYFLKMGGQPSCRKQKTKSLHQIEMFLNTKMQEELHMSLEIATFLGKVEEDESHQKCDYKFHQTPCSCFALSSALSCRGSNTGRKNGALESVLSEACWCSPPEFEHKT